MTTLKAKKRRVRRRSTKKRVRRTKGKKKSGGDPVPVSTITPSEYSIIKKKVGVTCHKGTLTAYTKDGNEDINHKICLAEGDDVKSAQVKEFTSKCNAGTPMPNAHKYACKYAATPNGKLKAPENFNGCLDAGCYRDPEWEWKKVAGPQQPGALGPGGAEQGSGRRKSRRRRRKKSKKSKKRRRRKKSKKSKKRRRRKR